MKKLYLIAAAALTCMAANAADYYLIGGFDGWALADPSAKFTEQADGTYTLDYSGTLVSGFKINDGTWANDEANFGSNGSQLVVGEEYVLGTGGSSGDIVMSGNVSNPHLVFNPSVPSLLVSGQAAQSVTKYGIHGQIFGDTAWSTTDMTESNGVWTVSGACVPGEFGIKAMDSASGAQTGWYSSAGEATVVLNTAMPVQPEGTNFTLADTGNFTITFNPSAMTLTVSGEGGPNPPTPPTPPGDAPEALYVIGNLNSGNWDCHEGVAMTKSGNVFTASGVTLQAPENTSGWFSFATVLSQAGEDWDDGLNMYDRYGAEIDGTALTSGTPATMTLFAAGVDASSAGSWMVPAAIYDITADFSAMTVTVVKVGDINDDPTPPEPPTPGEGPDALYVIGNLNGGDWDCHEGLAMTKDGSVFKATSVTLQAPENTSGWFSFATVLSQAGEDWDDGLNMYDRYGAEIDGTALTSGTPATMTLFAAGVDASSAGSWMVPAAIYDITADFSAMTVTVVKVGDINDDPTPPEPPTPDMPAQLYLIGNFDSMDWDPHAGKEMTKSGSTFVLEEVYLEAPENTSAWFSFATVLSQAGEDWDDGLNMYDRYGAEIDGTELTSDVAAPMTLFAAGVDASSAGSWMVPAGSYRVVADFSAMTVTATKGTGISTIFGADDSEAVYYNLQGVRVENPANGVFIRVANGKSSKVAR